MTTQEIPAMTSEEWEAFTKTLPCAVVDFRNCDPADDEDTQQQHGDTVTSQD